MGRRLAHACRAAVLAAAILASPATTLAQSAASPATPPDDPLARRAWALDLTGHGALEAWNYNGNHEELAGYFAGVTYGVREGLAVKVASPLYRVWQRGTDGYLFGVTWGLRGRLARKPKWSAFWEFEVGVSESDTYVPPGGTRFNYLAIGGGGVLVKIHPGIHALGGMRWVHISNNSLAGRSRNPDIEAIGPTFGLVYGF